MWSGMSFFWTWISVHPFHLTTVPRLRAMALPWWQNCRSLHGSMLLSEGKNENICPEIQCGVILGPRGPNECPRPGEVSCTLVIPTTAISLLGMNSELLNSICSDNLGTMLNASDNSPLTRPVRDLTAQPPPPAFLWSTGGTGNQSLLLPS